MKIYGLIGKSLSHSFSKKFFEKKFLLEKIEAEYLNFELQDIKECKDLFKKPNLAGLNVTIPYKQEIIPFLDELSTEAKTINAVNTISLKDGKLIGYNTDAFGFQQSIKPFLTFKHERAMILGSGGASLAIEYVLKNLGIDIIRISRNPKGEKQFSYSQINNHMMNACKLIVNCTPVGTFPNIDEVVDLPYEFFTDEHLAVDLIYNPEKTQFLKKAEQNGASILNGESMLKNQALEAYRIWNS
ncbi:MAG: shikimate dehydrogenase [Lentimonas sp.]|jgi:shikimate dehydrogenase